VTVSPDGVRRLHAGDRWLTLMGAIQAGDRPQMQLCAAADMTWRITGQGPYAGTYIGPEALAAQLETVRALTGGTFTLETELVLADSAAAVIVGRARARRPARTLDARVILLVRCDGDRVVEGWTVPMDQYEFDAFWS
jgi:ketosteroid isomerase-like protein